MWADELGGGGGEGRMDGEDEPAEGRLAYNLLSLTGSRHAFQRSHQKADLGQFRSPIAELLKTRH